MQTSVQEINSLIEKAKSYITNQTKKVTTLMYEDQRRNIHWTNPFFTHKE